MKLIDWWFLSKLFNRQNESKNETILTLIGKSIILIISIIIGLIIAYYCAKFMVFLVKL